MKTKTTVVFHDGADRIDTESFPQGIIDLKSGTVFPTYQEGICIRYEILGVTRTDKFCPARPSLETHIRVACRRTTT